VKPGFISNPSRKMEDDAVVLPPGMTAADVTRYSRQMLVNDIGGPGQARISQAKVLVVGAGGLGCSVIASLAGCVLDRIILG
jgi:adenylyltransferase/sulfurtransferase